MTDTSIRRLAEETLRTIVDRADAPPYPDVDSESSVQILESALTTLATSYEERIKALEYQLDVRTSEVEVWATRFNSAATQIREEDAPYMQHKESCSFWLLKENPRAQGELANLNLTIAECTCGLAAIRARQEKP